MSLTMWKTSKSTTTKLANGTITSVSEKTLTKMAVAAVTGPGTVEQVVANAVISNTTNNFSRNFQPPSAVQVLYRFPILSTLDRNGQPTESFKLEASHQQ